MNHHVTAVPSKVFTESVKTKIISTGSYLPPQKVTSVELFQEFNSESKYGTPSNWMDKNMGILERRVSSNNAKPSQLAIAAAHEALKTAGGTQIHDIDMVVFCGIERDQPEPATAHVVQNELGINARFVFDISNACYGFVNGIEVAARFIETGVVRNALICTGETPSKVLYKIVDQLKAGIDSKLLLERLGALSVGDAGGAVILGPSHTSEGFRGFSCESASDHVNKCIYEWNTDGTITGQMHMAAICREMIVRHNAMLDSTMHKLKWSSVDWLLTHQVGSRPFKRLEKIAGVNETQMIKTYPKLGNITSATFPVSFNKLVNSGKLSKGDKVAGLFAGSGIVIGQFGYTA